MKRNGASGEVINVATGGRISLNQLYQEMRDAGGGDGGPGLRETRAGDVRDSQADISKAQRVLGYEPTVSFEEGLAPDRRVVSHGDGRGVRVAAALY